MERITYRKTLDVHKNGVQCVLQGFETADNMSRVIEISLMASGDAIDFPLEKLVAVMYVTTPGASEPSINKCTIKDNKVVYEVLPIVVEGITTMQLKLIETSVEGAKRVLAAPKFAVEVVKSETDEDDAEQSTTFTALEDAMAKAKAVYDERFIRMELTSDCTFRAYYADGTYYETDVLKRLFNNGNVLLSESYAKGGTGLRAGEDTDNSKYYFNVARSEALNAKGIIENSEEILEEVRLHGVYTAFSVDFTTGEVEYVSPNSNFKVNKETGDLEVIGQTYTFEKEIERLVLEWFEANKINIYDLQNYSERLAELKDASTDHTKRIGTLEVRVTPIELGGTGAKTKEEVLKKLDILKLATGSFNTFISTSNEDSISAALGKNNEDSISYIGRQLAMYGWFKGDDKSLHPFNNLVNISTLNDMTHETYNDIIESDFVSELLEGNEYAKSKVFEITELKNIHEGTKTTNVTVTNEDLSGFFRVDYDLSSSHSGSVATITINGVKLSSKTSGMDDIHKKNRLCKWSDFGITVAGTYEIEATVDAVSNYATSAKVCLYKAKQSYNIGENEGGKK